MAPQTYLTLADIEAARERIAPYVRRTPVLRSDMLDEAAGAQLFFKCENLQEIGAFKARGATNAVFALSDAEAAHGVATHSSGNHGSAVALAAKRRGLTAYIVMPEGVAAPKAAQVARLGGRISYCAPTAEAREALTAQIIAETGATLVHPYDNRMVMAGQGTVALELMEDAPDLDVVMTPIGGGGLMSGVSTAVKALRPGAQVIGVEPAGADDAARSFAAGRLVLPDAVNTIADGLRAPLSEDTLAHILRNVDQVVTVSEAAIVAAMRPLWEALRVVVEPSGAVAYAAIRDGVVDVRGKRVGIVLTGGNVDLDKLPWVKA
ncbi:MAG TPA: pyridoxal-phosphate dependent enzyme [Caulobacteraceae bacterium]|jgi:threonine dehydratase|nr:pyridoxal-phosphate dependent enzyme [Caulobacteraceae bacterium]